MGDDAGMEVVPVALATAQAAFFFAYACTVVFWLLSEWLNWQNARHTEGYEELQQVAVKGSGVSPKSEPSGKGEEAATHTSLSISSGGSLTGPNPTLITSTSMNNGHVDPSGKGDNDPLLVTSPGRGRCRPAQGIMGEILSSPLTRCLLLDRNAIKAQRLTLRAMSEFGGLMLWYFFCDRTTILGSSGKSYSRDLFVFLFFLLTLVAGMTSLSTVKSPVFLVRQQTEEWKGWMQVLFLLYHYFEAKEAYNAIRIFIAGYVWMTGFGNFIYYYKTADFSIGRFAQMMWRLNFLVFFACAVLNNSYMLYYICPMHTLFTVMVYACLGIAPHLNQSRPWLIIKMVLCWLSVLVLWHQPVFYAMWSPLAWMVGYKDPRKPADQDIMHEWYFRSSLDRYVWIYGMICGMAQPAMQSALTALDQLPRVSQVTIRSAIVAVCGAVGYIWYTTVYTLPRNEYNQVHPYTSWIPITLWAIVRNVTPTLRLHHLRLYGWLGCITLETYICQFHIWMKTSIPDGQPKSLLVIIPGYPLLNFMAVTAGYIYVSFRLFELTNTLKNAVVPHNNNAMLLRNTLIMIAMGGVIYAMAAVVTHFWVPMVSSD